MLQVKWQLKDVKRNKLGKEHTLKRNKLGKEHTLKRNKLG